MTTSSHQMNELFSLERGAMKMKCWHWKLTCSLRHDDTFSGELLVMQSTATSNNVANTIHILWYWIPVLVQLMWMCIVHIYSWI